jgi:hypothetical protein
MKVLFYCGIGGCEKNGTLQVDITDWARKAVETICPACGETLRQVDLHFENFDMPLHRERADICQHHGPLTSAQRERLRKIHELLGHGDPTEFTEEQESLVMKVASEAWARIRNEEKN